MKFKTTLMLSLLMLGGTCAQAQLAKYNEDKFLGNITTYGSVNTDGIEYCSLWNQITPENESKWGSIETERGVFNWDGCDRAYNYAKEHGIPFKFHCLIWGAQYPSWMNSLSTEEQTKAITEWFDAVAGRYPDLQLIDVVNEAVQGHQPAPYKNALGGDGKTGYDWIIKAFEMAHERWPNAILIYNDYNTFQWQTDEFIKLVRTLIDNGAPIDAYGCQSHDLTDLDFESFKVVMEKIHNALQIPMYSTEYDIGTTDDALQLQRYKEQIPYMWESDYVAGITLWGYIYGKTWTTDGNSGIIRNGQDRPAMKWLREYMATDAAKNAKGPFPKGMKDHTVYVKVAPALFQIGDSTQIDVRAGAIKAAIDSVSVSVDGKHIATMTAEPYSVFYKGDSVCSKNVVAKVYYSDGIVTESKASISIHQVRSTFKGVIDLPGTIEFENFDVCREGVTFHDSDNKNEGDTTYRNDGEGVDIVTGNNGWAIGYTAGGEWLEYTVDVKEAGYYSFEAYASSGLDGSSFSIGLDEKGEIKNLANVPVYNSGDWNVYGKVSGRLSEPLTAGKHIVRVTIQGAYCNIDKVELKKIELNDIAMKVTSKAESDTTADGNELFFLTIGDVEQLCVETSSVSNTTVDVIKAFNKGIQVATMEKAPYAFDFEAKTLGQTDLDLIAYDVNGGESPIKTISVYVKNRRTPYSGIIDLPGTIEVENYDNGGQDVAYNDASTDNEGNANFRTGERVDIVKGNGGRALGYTAVGEWLLYSVEVEKTMTYYWGAVVSSGVNGSSFRLFLDDEDITGKISVPQTGNNNWDNYTTVMGETLVDLQAGEHVLKLAIEGANCNIDKLIFSDEPITGIEGETVTAFDGEYDVYSIMGVYQGTVNISNGDTSVMNGEFVEGIYILRKQGTSEARRVMVY